jgi:hypothetical protein
MTARKNVDFIVLGVMGEHDLPQSGNGGPSLPDFGEKSR